MTTVGARCLSKVRILPVKQNGWLKNMTTIGARRLNTMRFSIMRILSPKPGK